MGKVKTKDVLLVELYDREEVRMVLTYLRKKQMRQRDLERKQRDNREHLRKIGKAVA